MDALLISVDECRKIRQINDRQRLEWNQNKPDSIEMQHSALQYVYFLRKGCTCPLHWDQKTIDDNTYYQYLIINRNDYNPDPKKIIEQVRERLQWHKKSYDIDDLDLSKISHVATEFSIMLMKSGIVDNKKIPNEIWEKLLKYCDVNAVWLDYGYHTIHSHFEEFNRPELMELIVSLGADPLLCANLNTANP